MPSRLTFVLLTLLPWCSYAQTTNLPLAEMKGHFIGESVAQLLSKEPEVQQQVNACQQHAHQAACEQLLGGVNRGQRARISTSNWTSFVIDGDKLVKLQTLVHGSSDVAKADLSAKFGAQSSETAFPMQNAMGARWADHLSVWDTPAVYAGLREDNNPASQNHHLVLVVESREEHAHEREEMNPPSASKY